MKALVTYYSKSGNTEKLARAIYEAIHVEKEIIPVGSVQNTEGYDVIFVGFPVQAHSVPATVHPFFKGLPVGQKLVLFCTHGSLKGGHLPKQAIEHALSLAPRAKIIGTFCARGEVEPKVIEGLMNKPEHSAWAEEALGAGDHPDEADLADVQEFARGIIARLGH